jgi:hypothetical protein
MIVPSSFYPSPWLLKSTPALLTDAEYRARAPSLARSLRVAEIGDLAFLDPDLESLTGDDAERAERERERVEYVLFHGGMDRRNAVLIMDGAFPPPGTTNIISRARLQAHRNFATTHVFVRFATADTTPLWLLLSRPPWAPPPAPPPPRMIVHESLVGVRRPRTPRWIR